MKRGLLKNRCLRVTQQLLAIGLLIAVSTTPLRAQCLAGSNTANLNWDNLDYLITTGAYSGYVTAAMSQTQAFAIGVNRVVINYPGTITTVGENATHTGDGGSGFTGMDVQYTGNGSVTLTFDSLVNNVQFALYDIDANQRVNVTAVNGVGTPQIIVMTKPAGGVVTITGSGTTNAQGQSTATGYSTATNLATVMLAIAGPVKTVTITLSGTAGDFWLSDINACVVGSFPNNYFIASQPFTGQPTYVIGTSDTNTVSLINTTTGQARMIFQDATSPRYINGLGYDHLEHNLYYVIDFTSNPAINKTIKRYNFDTQTISVLVPNVNTLGIPTFNRGVESAGCAFYDSCLYFGVEGNITGNNGNRETIIWRIAFTAPGGAASTACQVYATPSDNGAGSAQHDWNDFTIADGLLVDFAGAPTTAARRFTHYDLQTQTIVQNYFTGGLTPRQAGITWNNTRYWIYDQIAVYNMNGTIGAGTNITGATVLDWTGFCGDATGFRPKSDFGDAPAIYDPVALSPALHEKDTTVRLGLTWDEEFNKISSVLATADGSDEDGISTVNVLDTGLTNYTASVTVYNNTGGNVTVIGWLDINGNGTFEASEGQSATVTFPGGPYKAVNLLWVNVNTPLPDGSTTYLRIRVVRAASGMTVNNATGYYNNGEVEDYPVFVSTLLPADLLSFDAVAVNDRSVRLNWTADNEVNLDRYEIQRSANGLNWYTINAVAAHNAPGLQNYTDWDNAPLKGTSYYRLRMVNNSNMPDKFSAIRSVFITPDKITLHLFPNPAREQVQLQIESDKTTTVLVRFTDATGRTILQLEKRIVTGPNLIVFNETANWPAGIYFVTLIENKEMILTKRLSVVK